MLTHNEIEFDTLPDIVITDSTYKISTDSTVEYYELLNLDYNVHLLEPYELVTVKYNFLIHIFSNLSALR